MSLTRTKNDNTNKCIIKDFKPLMQYVLHNQKGLQIKIDNWDQLLQTNQIKVGEDIYTLYHYNHKGFTNPYNQKKVVNTNLVDETSSEFSKKLKIILKTNTTTNSVNVVAQSGGYTPTYPLDDVNTDYLFSVNEAHKVYKYMEGTVLRLWYIGNEFTDESQPACMYGSGWVISTSNKIMGYKTKTNTKKYIGNIIDEYFGEYFSQILTNNELDKDACFNFLLVSKDTAMVTHNTINQTDPVMYYIGAYKYTLNLENNSDIFSTFYRLHQADLILASQYNVVLPIQINKDNYENYEIENNNTGLMVQYENGDTIKYLKKQYIDQVSTRCNTTNWEHWWYLQTWPGKNPEYTIVDETHFKDIMPSYEYDNINKWKVKYHLVAEKAISKLFWEYIYRLVNVKEKHNVSSMDEEWIIAETKRLYYYDRNNFLKMNTLEKFYWGGDSSNVNTYILKQIMNIFYNLRGDRLYRIIKLNSDKLNSDA